MEKAHMYLTISALETDIFGIALDLKEPVSINDEREKVIPIELPDPQTAQILRLLDVSSDGVGFLATVSELLEKIVAHETEQKDEEDPDDTKIFTIFIWKEQKHLCADIFPPDRELDKTRNRSAIERYPLYKHDDENGLIRAIYDTEVVKPYFHTFFILMIKKAHELRATFNTSAV